MKIDKNVESFLADSSVFIEEFESEFVEFFISLSLSYDKFYSKETLERVALLVYEDVFNVDIFVTTLDKEVFSEMGKDPVMMGFLINRSMFFLLENYLKQENNSNYIETLVRCISGYIKEFEKQICHKSKLQPLHIDFDITENFSVSNNILDIFKKIKDTGEDIKFFNLYKGIPIRHNAVVLDIDGYDVTFKTLQTQEVAMQIEGNAYILIDNNFDKPLKADIVYNNFSNNTVVLNNFRYLLNMPVTQREFVRVHPDIMAEVALSSEKNLVIRGKLFDLSIDGLGVVSEENNGIYAGAKIKLKFELSGINNQKPLTIEVDGEVLNIIEYSSSYRYCIRIYPKADMEEKIANYVNLREVEILNSLDKEIDFYQV